MPRKPPADPFAPPPMYHPRGGRFVRLGILAVLIGGAALGWTYFSSHNHDQTTALAPQAEQQQLADNANMQSYPTAAESTPAPAPAPEAAPAPAPAPRAAAPRRVTRATPAPQDSAPPPTTTSEPQMAPETTTPIAPIPPSG